MIRSTIKSSLANLALSYLDNLVLEYIKKNPGKRCHVIDKATLKSHHQWGTKHILTRLEQQGKVEVIDKCIDLKTQQIRGCFPKYYLAD